MLSQQSPGACTRSGPFPTLCRSGGLSAAQQPSGVVSIDSLQQHHVQALHAQSQLQLLTTTSTILLRSWAYVLHDGYLTVPYDAPLLWPHAEAQHSALHLHAGSVAIARVQRAMVPLLKQRAQSSALLQDCGGHGACLPPSGKCMCFRGYAGSNCGSCEAGFVRSPAASSASAAWCVPEAATRLDNTPVDVSTIAPFPPEPPLPPPAPLPPQALSAAVPWGDRATTASREVPFDVANQSALIRGRSEAPPEEGAGAGTTEAQREWQAERAQRARSVALLAAGVPAAAAAGAGAVSAAWWAVRRVWWRRT